MKSWGWAVGASVFIVIVFVFLYSMKLLGGKSPSSPTPIETPKEATGGSNMTSQSFEVLKPEQIEGKKVTIKTAKGDITIGLFGDAPLASSSFISLVTKKFYDGLTFHRREEGFVIQGGDPKGDGTGGPGYQFADEPIGQDYKRGVVAMANSGPNTNGSQFFIMLADYQLPKQYTIFGQVLEGIEVVDKIEVGDKMVSVTVK